MSRVTENQQPEKAAPAAAEPKAEESPLSLEMFQHLPEGGPELLMALATPTPRGHWGIPVLLWGPPGMGKSSFVESLARPDFPVYTLIASLHDPTDFNGLPYAYRGRMRFLPPAWMEKFEKTGQGILFLDELTTAPPAVQAALLRLVLERRVGDHALPPGVRVVAAANPPDQAAAGWELSPPLANRFVHLQWKMPTDTYLNALRNGFSVPRLFSIQQETHSREAAVWKGILAEFLRQAPSHLHTSQAAGEYACATPRTWDYAVALMATCSLLGLHSRGKDGLGKVGARAFQRLLRGCVGSGAATAFLEFLQNRRLPDPQAILEGRATLPENLRQDEVGILFEGMAGHLVKIPGSSPRLSPMLKNFLKALLEVAQQGRADVVFPVVRQLIAEGWLQRAAGTEHQPLLTALGSYYELLIRLASQISYTRQTVETLEEKDLPF